MDWMRLPIRNSLYARRLGAALGLSIGLHAALGLALFKRPLQSGPETTRPLRLSGGTFEVEAFEDSAGSPPEAKSTAASEGNAKSHPTPAEVEAPEAKELPSPDSATTLPSDADRPPLVPKPSPRPQSAPEHSAARQAVAPPASSPAPPTRPVDPFDLALPGSAKAASGSPGAPESAQAPGGSYGEEGAPSGVVDLHAAFLKTLPLAAKSDNAWTNLPLGDAGSIVVKLTIDKSLKLAPIAVIESPEQPAPLHLKQMVLKNRDWLHTQRFSIGPQTQAGTQLLRISAVISQRTPDAHTPDATGTQALGTRGGTTPTGAYFTYFSGRHVEFRVEKLGSSSVP